LRAFALASLAQSRKISFPIIKKENGRAGKKLKNDNEIFSALFPLSAECEGASSPSFAVIQTLLVCTNLKI